MQWTSEKKSNQLKLETLAAANLCVVKKDNLSEKGGRVKKGCYFFWYTRDVSIIQVFRYSGKGGLIRCRALPTQLWTASTENFSAFSG